LSDRELIKEVIKWINGVSEGNELMNGDHEYMNE